MSHLLPAIDANPGPAAVVIALTISLIAACVVVVAWDYWKAAARARRAGDLARARAELAVVERVQGLDDPTHPYWSLWEAEVTR